MRVVAVAGAKGGVGKTATAVNLAMLSAAAGYRTLLWDLDPQGAATHCYRARARLKGGASRLLGGKRDLDAFVRSTDYVRLDLLPADPSFRVVDTILSTRRWPERVLRKLIRPLDELLRRGHPGLRPGPGRRDRVGGLRLGPDPGARDPGAARRAQPGPARGVRLRATGPACRVLAFLSMLDDRKVLHRQVVAQIRSDRRFGLTAVPCRPRSSAWAWSRSPPSSPPPGTWPRSPTAACGRRWRTAWTSSSPAGSVIDLTRAEATAMHAG